MKILIISCLWIELSKRIKAIATNNSVAVVDVTNLIKTCYEKEEAINSIVFDSVDEKINYYLDVVLTNLHHNYYWYNDNMSNSFTNNKTFIGYRNIKSSIKGKYGTFYSITKTKHYQTRKVELTFKNPLIITDKNVHIYEGLTLEYLFWNWFPDLEDKYVSIAKKQGIETGELMDKLVTKEAVKRGYDAIVMDDLEMVDLRTHDDF